jgi:hypothetical protein
MGGDAFLEFVEEQPKVEFSCERKRQNDIFEGVVDALDGGVARILSGGRRFHARIIPGVSDTVGNRVRFRWESTGAPGVWIANDVTLLETVSPPGANP